MEANCHVLAFPHAKGRVAFCHQALASAVKPSSSPRVAAPEERTGRGQERGGGVEFRAAKSLAAASRLREASTLVLFSIGQMWYLHAIVRRSRRIQNSGCVDPVRESRFCGFIGSLQHSVHTCGCFFGSPLRVMRNE